MAPRASVWGAPVATATEEHVVAWSDTTLFSVAAVSVVAAASKRHPDVECSILVRISNVSGRVDTLPRVQVSGAGVVVVTVPVAHAVSWRYVWRSLRKAKDAADALDTSGPVRVELRLIGNPLNCTHAHPVHPAWSAFVAASPDNLMPCPTDSFFKWALANADRVDVDPTVCAASMYPSSSADVAEMLRRAKSGFPRVDDEVVVEASLRMFPEVPGLASI